MAKLKQFCELALDLADSADFITVYTEEAHATDRWAFKDNAYNIPNHTSIHERSAAARELAKLMGNTPTELLIDNMDNTACLKYASSPDRLYVLLDGIVVYQGGPGPMGYKPDHLRTFLMSQISSTPSKVQHL